LKNHIKNIFKSDFNRNILMLSSGTALSQLILVLISPILTRLYSPDAFGVFAIFLSISAIIGSNINLKFEQAIMLPKDQDDAYKLAYLSNYLNFGFSLVVLLLIIIFYGHIATLLNVDPKTSYWLFLVPVATYFIGFNNVLVNLNNRLKNYKSMSGSVIAKNATMTLVQLLLGFFKFLLSSGLIIGQLVAYAFGNRVLRLNVDFRFKKMFGFKLKDFKDIAKRYKDFPRFAFPAGIANAATLNITNILITSVYSVSYVGFFSLANRILGAPSALISQSISQVYYQNANEEKINNGSCIVIFKSTLKKLVILAVSVFIPLALLSELLFPFIFGNEWKEAGTLAKYLSVMFAFRFVSSALSVTLNVTENQKFSLYINLILLAINISVIGLSLLFKLTMIDFAFLYCITMSLAYLVFIYIYYEKAKIKS